MREESMRTWWSTAGVCNPLRGGTLGLRGGLRGRRWLQAGIVERCVSTHSRTAVRSRHCGAPALLLAHPPGAPRHSRCAMAKTADVWSDLSLVFWLACLLPLGPARVAAGKPEPAWSCPVLSGTWATEMTRGVVPLLDTPLPRSRPALGVSPCSLPRCLPPALCPGKHIHPDAWDWYSLGGGTGSMDACWEPRVGWERGHRASDSPRENRPPSPVRGSAFALRCRLFLEISTVIALA